MEGPDLDVEVAGLGAFRGGPEAVLRESWVSWGPFGSVLGRLGAVLSWFWGPLGVVLCRLGAILGTLGTVLEPFWTFLGVPMGSLEGIPQSLGQIFGDLEKYFKQI